MSTNRIKTFSPLNPVGDSPGMESVNVKLLEAVVANTPPEPSAVTGPIASVAQSTKPTIQRVNKNIRLPADLVDFIDFEYARLKRIKQQDAYTEALEAFFRPLMGKHRLVG